MSSSKSVNVPVDPKVKERDVNAKLQLYGIYSAFAQGKVPSNKQIDVALNSALEWQYLNKPDPKLSADGKKLVADLKDVIEQSKLLLLSKNHGDLLQDFIWQTQKISAADAPNVNTPLDKDTAQQHGQQALEGLRTLGTLLITNGQFRKLLSDASVLIRDIAGDAAVNTANVVKPNEDQLATLDKPAEDNTWHDAPDLSKEKIANQIKAALPIGKKDVDQAVGDASAAAHPDGSRDPNAVAEQAQKDAKAGGQSVDPVAGAKAAKDTLLSKVDDDKVEEAKQNAREYREKTREYFKGKFPKDRREQTIYRLKKMIVEIQGHSDYRQAIDTLLRLAEEYAGHTKTITQQGTAAVQDTRSKSHLQQAETDLRTLLERFANSTSFDDLFASINQIYTDADRDPELKNWFKSIDAFIRKSLQQQGYVLQDESEEEWNKLYDHGNYLLREKYKAHTDRVADEFKFIANQFEADSQNKSFAAAFDRLFKDLGNDDNGKPEFKPHLVKDLTDVLLPAFFENVRYIPIPRIEYSDPTIDAVVENLVIEGDNLAPNQLEFGSDNFWRWGRKNVESYNKNKVLLSVSGVQADLRDVAYYVKKKEGFPGITDKGVADIFLGGSGFSFKVALETADKKDRQHFFKITKVSVDVKNLNIKLKQSNHKLLFSIAKPLLTKVLRPVLEKVLEKQIRDSVNQADAFLYSIQKEVDRAIEEAKNNPDPENLQNIYQRYATAFQQQINKAQRKKEEVKASAADKEVNIAVTQHDSIFKHISLPGGISSKATEYRDLAAKGDKWESPVFSIGSASATTNLPKAADPVRKPHTAGGQVLTGGPAASSSASSGGLASGFASTTATDGIANQLGAAGPTSPPVLPQGAINPIIGAGQTL
ncbi:uncharacterized protein K489DRAFT_383542 [Dissoconium aciculare CBS 342.82]|uniref:Uncharacterized protein n=1 Tax=Dissoconium aciculare CBS 342.82 TaxID=1314786 RepID=A0A6J3LZC0_9PEZI|nr:uncharacterized protein K489DRAFT_383542 [Dissoconium aciculare CBS 342.82]KAF1819987.1 hypothetical protein K489DRAFT_383542 [Dissoconium aciculare CBS 342.82]